MLSVLSTEGSVSQGGTGTGLAAERTGPSLREYVEAFLQILVVLNHKRLIRSPPPSGLLALSPLAERVGVDSRERLVRVSVRGTPVTCYNYV